MDFALYRISCPIGWNRTNLECYFIFIIIN